MPADTWWVSAHSATVRGSSGVLCMVWHEKQESVRSGEAASVKQGESMRPLYSRPETRTSPSAQNDPRTKSGSEAIRFCIAGDRPLTRGWATKRVSRSSSPGRNGRPPALAARSLAESGNSQMPWHWPQTCDERCGSRRVGSTMVGSGAPPAWSA